MDFDPQAMRLNDYAHARASAHCAFLRLLWQAQGAFRSLSDSIFKRFGGVLSLKWLAFWCFSPLR